MYRKMVAIWTVEEFQAEYERRVEASHRNFLAMMAAAEEEIQLKLCLYSSKKTIVEEILEREKSKRNLSDDLSVTSILSKKRQRSLTTEDEGYMTEESRNKRPAQSPTLSKTQVNFAEKTLFNGSVRKLASASERMSRSRFRTPSKALLNRSKYGLITPKAVPNKPLALMRRPMEGEMAVSLSGSPLYVSNISNDKLANVNIPFANGRIMSLLPTRMGKIDPEDLPEFDPDTKKQIKMLTENLNNLNKLVQKSKK